VQVWNAEAVSGSLSKRRTSVLSPTKTSLARSPSKGAAPAEEEGEGEGEEEDSEEARFTEIEKYCRHQEHIPLDVFASCGARQGDLYICIEHCFDCGTHGMSLRHDQSKYLQVSNAVLGLLAQTAFSMKGSFSFIQRVFALRVKPTAKSRLGALEVTVSYKTRVRRRPRSKADLIKKLRSAPVRDSWLTHRIHSKLGSAK
jgi:hypothetical protein